MINKGDAQMAQDPKEAVVQLPIQELRPNPYQPRHVFEPEALQELSASIQASGVFQPIIVRQSIQGYEIIAGERRVRASELAGKTTVPAIIRPLDEAAMMEVAVLENLQRENLNPIEEAQAYETLIQRLNLTQAQVSQRLGKSRPYIANYLRLLTLPVPVKQLVQTRQLTMGQARTLLALKDKPKITALAKRTVKEALTVRQLEDLVAEANQQPKTKAAMPVKSTFTQTTEAQLAEKFGTKVTITGEKQGHGKLEIDYTSMTDLNRILEILGFSLD
ncbi:ParB/RepB/Spo0J family partition protein [Agrilactobacillus yilanensis]|uniref:ParB/RepB/Spo0J family partition protein n=1 Tax=Agrilactobacillus yilanensis TaxID=2485997 RepID=A0ABW4J7V6_9LACO